MAHGATWPIDQSGSSICRDVQSSERDFPEKSGRHLNERSRRERARHTRWHVHFAACNCTAITAARNLPSVWSASVIIAYAREKLRGWLRSCGIHSNPALILQLVDKRHDWFSPTLFRSIDAGDCGTARCCILEFPEWSFVTKFISNNAFIRCGFLANMCDTLRQHFSNYLSSARAPRAVVYELYVTP